MQVKKNGTSVTRTILKNLTRGILAVSFTFPLKAQ